MIRPSINPLDTRTPLRSLLVADLLTIIKDALALMAELQLVRCCLPAALLNQACRLLPPSRAAAGKTVGSAKTIEDKEQAILLTNKSIK